MIVFAVYLGGVIISIPFTWDEDYLSEAAVRVLCWPIFMVREFVRGFLKVWTR